MDDNIVGLENRIKQIFETKMYADCEFVFPEEGPTSGSILAHKIILAAVSPVFERMLFGPLAEKGPIAIRSVSMEDFEQLIRFAYLQEAKVEEENVVPLFVAAHMYAVEEVQKNCLHYMKDNLKVGNLMAFSDLAKVYDLSDLNRKCQYYLQSNSEEIFAAEEFLKFDVATVEMIFDLPCLRILSEIDVFYALERYAKHNGLKRSDDEPDNVTNRLLGKVRFLSMTPDEFLEATNESKLLTENEKLAILSNLCKEIRWPLRLPEFCSTKKQNRCCLVLELPVTDRVLSNSQKSKIAQYVEKLEKERRGERKSKTGGVGLGETSSQDRKVEFYSAQWM